MGLLPGSLYLIVMKKIFVTGVLMGLTATLPFFMHATPADPVSFTKFTSERVGGYSYLLSVYGVTGDVVFAYPGNGNSVHLLNSKLQEVYSFEIPSTYKIDWLECADYDTDPAGGIFVTQHVFNDDDLYEVVVHGPSGLLIMNENGEILGECPSDSYIIRNGNFYLSSYEGSPIWMINNKEYSNNIDITTNLDTPEQLTVYPVPANNDETIIISLPDKLSEKTTLSIYTLNGTLLFKKDCEIGESLLKIPAYRLNKGINSIIVVDQDQNIIATGKAVLN